MKKITVKTLYQGALAIAAAALLVDACAESGQVLERGTNKPLAGVYVIAEWRGSIAQPVQSRSVCYDADVAVTDGEGRYSIREFSGNLNPVLMSRRRFSYAFSPKYAESPNSGPLPSPSIENVEINKFMTTRTGTRNQQFDTIANMHLASNCNEDKRKFLPVRKLRALELQLLAETHEQFELADGALYVEDRIELGEDAAVLNKRKRERERAAAKAK